MDDEGQDDKGAGTDGAPGQGAPTGGPDNATDDATDDAKDGKPNGKPGDDKPGDDGTDWKARSRQNEDRAKANKKAADEALAERDQARATLDALRKLVDPNAKADEDPKEAAQKLLTRAEQAEAKLRARDIRDALAAAGRKAGADTDLLVDSKAVLDKAADLDPSDPKFAADVEAIVEQALEARPSLKANKPKPRSGAADMTGGGANGSGQLTRADLKTMTPAAIEKARKDGRLKNLLGG